MVKELSDRFKVKPEELPERVSKIESDLRATQKQVEALKSELAVAKSDSLLAEAESVGEFKVLVARMDGADADGLKTAAERLQQKLGESAVLLGGALESGKVSLVAAFSKSVNQKGLQVGNFADKLARLQTLLVNRLAKCRH